MVFQGSFQLKNFYDPLSFAKMQLASCCVREAGEKNILSLPCEYTLCYMGTEFMFLCVVAALEECMCCALACIAKTQTQCR